LEPHFFDSGPQELDTLYASNDCQLRGGLTVNLVNAPNNSTVQVSKFYF
jgi:hypothetical protein